MICLYISRRMTPAREAEFPVHNAMLVTAATT